MAKHKAPEPEKDNSERWLLTYSDLMNLLLILFIIFYSMSQVDKAKAEKVTESIREGFGYVMNGGTGETEGEGTGLYGLDFTPDEGGTLGSNGELEAGLAAPGSELYWSQQAQAFQTFYEDILKLLKDNNLEDMIDVKLDDRGVVISFKDNALFRSGDASLSTASLELIDNISLLLRDLQFTFILVEGHTDTDPIHTALYKDNMDLSTQRAANVWREMIQCGLPADKMASIGYGEYRPVAPNDTSDNKAMNRRVVITILRKTVNSSDEIIAGASAPDQAAAGNNEG